MSDYVIIRGPLGVGKTTVAARLAQALDAYVVSIDELLEELGSVTWEEGYISQRSFRAANRLAAERGRRSLQSGRSVIFDGNFYWKSQIEDLIHRLPFAHRVFTLRAPLKVCRDRDRARAKPLGGTATREVYRKSTEFTYGTPIDANRPLDEVVAEIQALRIARETRKTEGVPAHRAGTPAPRSRSFNRAGAARRSAPPRRRSLPVD
jgi:predicted kinase